MFFFFFFNPFSSEKVRFTGQLERFTRKEAKAVIKKMGGIPVKNDVTKDTKFLVVADSRRHQITNNMRIAEKYGVTVISEQEFYDIVDSELSPSQLLSLLSAQDS